MGDRKLLLVDDELALLRLMERFLTRAGFAVDACELGQEAWRLFETEGSRYDAVIVDLGLPDIPGDELLRRMRAREPNLRAVICSGAPEPTEELRQAGLRYLRKPFLPKMLVEAVEGVTETPSNRS